MNNELRKIVEQRLKNAKANALAVGTETVTGKMFTGKAELLESILEEYVALPIHVVVSTCCDDKETALKNKIRLADIDRCAK